MEKVQHFARKTGKSGPFFGRTFKFFDKHFEFSKFLLNVRNITSKSWGVFREYLSFDKILNFY